MSIRLRIALLMALVLAVGIAASSILMSLRLSSQLAKYADKRALMSARHIAEIVRRDFDAGNVVNITNIERMVHQEPSETLDAARVIDRHGKVITARGTETDSELEGIARKSLRDQEPLVRRIRDTRLAAAPVIGPGGQALGAVSVRLNPRAVPHGLMSIRVAAVQAGIAALLIGIVLSYLFARYFTSSLRTLLGPMREIAAGDYESRVPTELPREMQDVALAFNDMALAINRRVRNLEMLNELAAKSANAKRLSDIAKHVNAAATMVMEARARIWVFNQQTDKLESVPAEGLGGRIVAGAGCAVTVAARESRLVTIGENEERPPNSPIVTGLDPVSAAVVIPLLTPEGTVGSVSFESIVERRWMSPEEKTLATAIANTASPAIFTHMQTEGQARYARLLQQVLVPGPPAKLEGIDVAAWYRPAGELGRMGGDYYDFIVLSNDEMWIAIGDVSGKGLPAAEYTAMVKYVLRSYLLEYRSPARALSLTNLALSAQMRPEAFITLFCGLINVPGRTIKYAGAGHPYPILLSPEGEISELKTEGVAAAMFSDASYVEKEAQLRPGDTLILYTDGLSEARLGMAMYEERRLWEAVRECAGMSARDTANHLAEDVQAFTAGRLQDDIAIVVVQIAQQ